MLSSKMTPLRMRNDYDYLLSAHEIMQLDSLTFMVSIPQTDQNSPGSRFRISHIPNMRFSSETKTYLIYATFCNIRMTNKKQKSSCAIYDSLLCKCMWQELEKNCTKQDLAMKPLPATIKFKFPTSPFGF